MNKPKTKKSLSLSMAKIILAISFIVGIGSIIVVFGYFLTKQKPVANPPIIKNKAERIEISADAKSILNADTKAVIFTIADTQKYLKDSGYLYNPDTFQTTNAKYEGDCFLAASLSNNKDRIVFSTGCLPGDLPQAWAGIHNIQLIPYDCPSINAQCKTNPNPPKFQFLIGGSGRNFIWSSDDKTIAYEADLGLSGMTETRTIDAATGKTLDRKLITDDEILPQFKDYQVTEKFQGKPVAVDLDSDPGAREFRSVLREGVKDGPNFAGHYTVVEWGCGTECAEHAIVDNKTGKVHILDSDNEDGLELSFRLDSSLLIVNPPSMIEEMNIADRKYEANPIGPDISAYYPRYYKWENDKLELVYSTKVDTADWKTYSLNSLDFKYPPTWTVEKTYYSTPAQQAQGIAPENIGVKIFSGAAPAGNDFVSIGGRQTSCDPSEQHIKCFYIYSISDYIYTDSKDTEIKNIFDQILSTFKFTNSDEAATISQPNIKIENNASFTKFTIKNNNKIVGEIATQYESNVKIFRQTKDNIYLGVEPSGIGGYILYGGPHTLYKLDLKTDILSKINTDLNQQGFFTDIYPDETRVAYVKLDSMGMGGGEGERHVVAENINSGLKQLFGASLKYKIFGDALFSPDGEKIAYAAAIHDPDNEEGAVFIVDIASGKQTTVKTKTGSAFQIKRWIDNDNIEYE